MIQKELLPIELRRAERAELYEYCCKRCEKKDRKRAVAAGKLGKGATPGDVEIKHECNCWKMPMCKECRRNVEDDGLEFLRSRREYIAQLLQTEALMLTLPHASS